MRLLPNGTALLAVTALTLVAGCATDAEGDIALDAPLPTGVTPDASLTISEDVTRVALETTGKINDLPFTVSSWNDISGGPDVIQAFRGEKLDIASNAGIPPISARGSGFKAKIVGVKIERTHRYKLATAPGSTIESAEDLRGKKIAFSPGQAQGLIVLRTLNYAGIPWDQVELVELQAKEFISALQGGQVDVAPLHPASLAAYLRDYEAAGARTVHTDAIDLLSVLWSPEKVLKDSAKLSAVKEFVKIWARSEIWAWEHPDQWRDAYWVNNEGLTPDEARIAQDAEPKPYFPDDWDEAKAWEQESVDIVTKAGDWFGKSFDAEQLFDRRFENVAAEAVLEQYRTEETP